MRKRITFRSMGHSDSIEKYIYKKIEIIDKFFKRQPLPIYIDTMIEGHKERDYFTADVKLNSSQYHITIHTQGVDVYSIIDEAIYRLIKNITRKKERSHSLARLSYSL